MSGLYPLTVNTAPSAEPHIYAEDDAAIYQTIFGKDGVCNIGSICAATIISNNKIEISDGVLCVGGHIARIPFGDYQQCEIANGQTGYNRNDIIIARFVTTGEQGIDTYTVEVIQGSAVSDEAVDPELVQGNLYAGEKERMMPLYRVKIEGLSITGVEQLFEVIPTISELRKEIEELEDKSTRETVLWSADDAIYSGTIELSDDLFKYKHLVFMEDNKMLFEIPVIQGMTEAHDASTNSTTSYLNYIEMTSLNVTNITATSLEIAASHTIFTHTTTKPVSISKLYINKIIGIQ